MSTMEHLFMQIFDRRRRIEDQFRHQVQSYGESLASNLLAEGRRPPSWLWTSGSDDLSRHEWNREQLISEILDPLPRFTTPANSSSPFILPTLKGKSVNLFNSNNVFPETHAQYFDAMANNESVYTDIPEDSRRNTEKIVEPEATEKNSMTRQPTKTKTSGTKHGKADMPPSKKAKIVKYPVEENTLHEFTGRVTRSMGPCLNYDPVKDSGQATESRYNVRKDRSIDQSSKLAKPQSNFLSACIDNHALGNSVDELSLHATYTTGNGCVSTNSISSRLSAITLSVSAFGMENHERSSEVSPSKLDADAANILDCHDYSHGRKLNDDIFHALEGTRSVEAVDIDTAEGSGKEVHQAEDPGCDSHLRCHDCQSLSTNNPVTDIPGQLNELQDCGRKNSIDILQQHTPEEHCNIKMMELSEPFFDVFVSNDNNSIDASVKGLNNNSLKASFIKLNSALKDRLVPGHSMIAEDTSRRWSIMREDVSDSAETILQRDEIDGVSNGYLEGVELPGGNSECITQPASYHKNSCIFVNVSSNPPSNKDGPVNSSMDSFGHTSNISDCSREKTFRNPVLCTEEKECCEKPKNMRITGKSEGSYPVEKVHFPSRRKMNDIISLECGSSEKLVSYSDVTNRVSDGDQADIIGTEDSASYSYHPVCTGDALLPTISSLKENDTACSSPDTGNMLNYVKGLSVQPNLMQDNGEERMLEIPTQYSEGDNVMEESETEMIASSLKQIGTMHYHSPPLYSSEANEELVGTEETNNSAKQISERSTVKSIVPPGASQIQNVILRDTGNMLNYVKGLSVQPNLMQDNGEERMLEIPTQYSEGDNVMEESETEMIASSLKQIGTMHYHSPPLYSSEANEELVGTEETNNSAKQISERSTVKSIVPPGASQIQNVILRGTSNAKEIDTINDKITPDAKIMCNAVPKARYFLRSSTIHDKQSASLESSRIDDSNNLRQEVDTCNITWPKRKYNGRSSNVFATSPRLRLKTRKHIEKQTDCMWTEILNNTSGSRNGLQPFELSCETEVVLSEVAVHQFEEHVSKKSRIMKADHDLKGKCQAVRTPLSIKHKLDLDLADDDSNTITESTVLNLEQCPVLQGVLDSLGRSEHRSPTTFGSFEENTGMEQIQAGEGIFNTSYSSMLPYEYDRDMDGLEETMPEFEGFISIPSVIEDEIICNDSEIPSLSKERASLLEQLSRSESILTAKSCPSLKFTIDKLPDVYHSLPAGILEKLNLRNYLRLTDIDLERFSTAKDAKTSDPFCSLESELDSSLLRSHSSKLPPSNAKYAWEACKPPLTPPVDKMQQRMITKKSIASPEKRGSNPELVCFRIDENSSTTEESISEQGVSYKVIQNSTNRVALADVTSVHQNVPTSISMCGKYLERGSLDSANTMPQMEIDLKENDDLSVSCRSVQSSNDFHSQLNKTDISGKAKERKGGRTVSGGWCKPRNIISNISSFVPFVREKQQIAAPGIGKRDIKVKALEAAEAAKRLEEKRQYEREMRKAAAKLERVRLEKENVQRLELKQKEKDEFRKKREADLEARKRQRDVEMIEKVRKKRCTEEARKHQRANLERSWVEKGDKVLRDKNAKGKKRKGKELTKDAKKKQARLVREREVAANKKTAELVQSVSKVVSADSGHVNSGVEAHGVFLKENDFSKMANSSYALQTAIEDRMSVVTETQDLQSYEISPYKDSDDEDGDEDRLRRKKCIPAWARRESLEQIVLSRCHLDPTEIFACKRSFDLTKVLLHQVPRRLLS